jgi:hypothetical protein
LQGAEKTKEDSYAGLANRTCGPLAEGALQLGLFGFCFGVMAVYLVVIGDILAGGRMCWQGQGLGRWIYHQGSAVSPASLTMYQLGMSSHPPHDRAGYARTEEDSRRGHVWALRLVRQQQISSM